MHVPRKQLSQLLHRQDPVRDLPRGLRVVRVQRLAGKSVCHGQCAARGQQSGQMRQQPLRLRKMRKRVVDHNAVERGREVRLLRVAAEHGHVLLRELFARDARHLRRNVDGRHLRRAALQIVRDQHTRPARHVQHPHTAPDPGVVQDPRDHRLIAPQLCVPAGGRLIEKFDHILLLHLMRTGRAAAAPSSAPPRARAAARAG